MKKLKIIPYGLGLLLVYFTLIFGLSGSGIPEVPKAYLNDFLSVQQRMQGKDYDEAMEQISRLLTQTEALDKSARIWLLERQAKIHESWLHYHAAREAYRRAAELDSTSGYWRDISRLTARIDALQQERQLRQSYPDSRNSGIAKSLKNKVTIAYIYLDDNRWSKWSGKARMQNHTNLEHVIHWYKAKASQYGVKDLEFDLRYFFISSPQGLSREWLRSKEFFPYADKLMAQQLGFTDIRAFVNSLKATNPDTQVALVFHTNAQARSFAMQCPASNQSPGCKLEYAMITEKIRNKPLVKLTAQTQSHEILHLFGAADLYNIQAAKDYAVTDVMNYFSIDLQHAALDPITAWAIGWSELPPTPFEVKIEKEQSWK